MSVQSRDLVVRLMAQSNGFEKGMKSAAASADVFAKELEKIDRRQTEAIAHVARLRAKSDREAAVAAKAATREAEAATQRRLDAYDQVGKGAMVSGAAMAAGLALATGAALKWESAWAGVTKTVDGNAQQMQVLEDDLRELAKTLPATHTEIAAVAEAAGQLGVRREDITSFTKVMIDLGETTNLTALEASTAVAQLANVMGTSGDEVDNLAATLVALGNDGASTEKQILDMALRLSGAGKLIGASEGEILAMANAMASMGIEAELGGGAMSRTLIKIDSAVKSGGEEVAAFARVAGMSAQEFAQAFESDPIRAVDAFVQGLNRVDEAGGNATQVLDDLGISGTQDLQVLLRLKGAGDLLADSLDLQSEAWAANVALAKEAAKRYETTEAKVRTARNALNDFAIDMGNVLLPALAAGAEGVADVAGFLGGLPGPMQVALTVLAGLTAAISLAGGAALVAVPKIVAFKAAVDTLSVSSPAAARGVSGLTTALSLLGRVAVGGAIVGVAMAIGDLAARDVDLDKLSRSVTTFAEYQKVSGELLRLVGEDFADFGETLELAGKNQALELLNPFGESWTTISEKRGDLAALDQTLTELVTSGNTEAAAALFGRLSDAAKEQGLTVKELLEIFPEYGEALATGAGAQDELTTAAAGTAGALDGETKSLQDLMKEVRGATDLVLGLRDANRGYETALDAAAASLKENGKTLDINTEKGRANEAALDAIASSAADVLQGMVDSGRPISDVTAKFGQQRTALIKAAESFGMTRGQAEAYVDSVLRIPEKKVTAVTLKGAEAALAQADRLREYLARLTNKTVTVRVDQVLGTTVARPGGGRVIEKAAGGLVDYYANGGLREQHVAQIAPAGSWRVWAEPETGGEAYIPLSPSKRARSIEIWRQTGRRLQMLGNGGVLGRRPDRMGRRGDDPDYGADVIRGRSLIDAAKRLTSVEQVRALVEAWEDYNDQLAQAARRQELVLDEKAARKAFDLAKGMKARTEALEELKDAQKKLREFDAAAAVDRERKAVDKILDTLAAEEKARDAAARAAEELAEVRERAAEQAEDAQERALDRLNKLLDTEKALRHRQLQGVQRHNDERARIAARGSQQEARLAADQRALRSREAQAEERHLERLAMLRLDLAADEARLLTDRRDQLAGGTALSELVAFERGLPADWLVANARRQIEALAEWMEELNRARGRGVSEQVITALGLDKGPQTLAQVRALTRASADEIDALNDAVEQRTQLAGEQVRREQVGNYGQLGQALLTAQQQYATAVNDLRAEYRSEQERFAAELVQLQSEYVAAQQQIREELAAAQDQFVAEQTELADELAALGQEQGRALGEALAEGMRSQIPAVRAAAQALAEAMAVLAGAQAAQTGGSTSAHTDRPSAKDTGPFKRVGLRQRTYDVGGWLEPGYTLAYNGTGRPERILTAQQMGGMGSRVVQFMPNAAVTIRETADMDLLIRRAEFLTSAGGFE